jgi:hypothetical protein|tara:strand:- start:1419 stop:1748 length:330 start_codon:yes stop_codon:yes gene_type:complete
LKPINKTKKIKNKKFLEYVSNQECCLSTYSPYPCNGNVQAHHLLKPYYGVRGMGMRASDNNSVPLCYTHHAQLHDSHGNEDLFWKLFRLTEDYGREIAEKYWEKFNEKN